MLYLGKLKGELYYILATCSYSVKTPKLTAHIHYVYPGAFYLL